MIFNPKEGGRLVLPVDEGSLVIDVKSARLAYQAASISTDRHHQTIIKLDCELIGTIVKKDTKGDRTDAVILHGERDDPDAIVLSTKQLTDVNVSTNFPGSTEITIKAYGLPIEYSKMVEKALQDKPKPVGPGNTSMGSASYEFTAVNGYVVSTTALPQASPKPSPTQSVKVWPGISISDEEILEALNDQED